MDVEAAGERYKNNKQIAYEKITVIIARIRYFEFLYSVFKNDTDLESMAILEYDLGEALEDYDRWVVALNTYDQWRQTRQST